MISNNYRISKLNDPKTRFTMSGSGYFRKNLNPNNYSIKDATIRRGVLRMRFEPRKSLPAFLRGCDQFIEVEPQSGVVVVLKRVINEGDRYHVFYCVIESVDDGICSYSFNVSRYSKCVEGYYADDVVHFDNGKVTESGLRLIDVVTGNDIDLTVPF